jgi:DNA repair protein RecO (recombination protein O)
MAWFPSLTTRLHIVHKQEGRLPPRVVGISVMEWDSPAIVLDARPYGEGDAVATVMTEAHGLHRGLARGGASRGKAATWQAGNLVHVRWTARLSDQLGSFTGELIHPGATQAMQEALPLSMLTSACAVAEGALPERVPQPRSFHGLLGLIPRLPLGEGVLADVVRWELVLLAELGYGLDLSVCAVTGRQDGLVLVSPRTGRAVTRAGAGDWESRLLPLPEFLICSEPTSAPSAFAPSASTPLASAPRDPVGDPIAWRDGLRLTGHFLARDAFGLQHRPLPQARQMLYDRVSALAEQFEKGIAPTHAG